MARASLLEDGFWERTTTAELFIHSLTLSLEHSAGSYLTHTATFSGKGQLPFLSLAFALVLLLRISLMAICFDQSTKLKCFSNFFFLSLSADWISFFLDALWLLLFLEKKHSLSLFHYCAVKSDVVFKSSRPCNNNSRYLLLIAAGLFFWGIDSKHIHAPSTHIVRKFAKAVLRFLHCLTKVTFPWRYWRNTSTHTLSFCCLFLFKLITSVRWIW